MRRGFTLIELLIVLAILSVTVAILIPSFAMVSSAQVSVAAKDTLRLMRYARNMALQTQQPVTLAFAPGTIRISSPFDQGEPTVATTGEGEPQGEGSARRKAPPNALQAGGIDTVALTKTYDLVAFEFLGFDDTVRSGSRHRPIDFTRRAAAAHPEEMTEAEPRSDTFSVTVRANGTVRPFTLRVYERDTEKQGDTISFDFLCSGTIGGK